MLMRKLVSIIAAIAVCTAVGGEIYVCADEVVPDITCSQSASFLADGSGNVTSFVLNTQEISDAVNISWNTAVKSWKGVGGA